MKRTWLLHFALRCACALLLVGGVYFFAVYLPRQRAVRSDLSQTERETTVDTLERIALQKEEFNFIAPQSPSVYTDTLAYLDSYQQAIISLESQRNFVNETFPDQIEKFDALTKNTQVVWLELSGFYGYVDVLLAYNFHEDISRNSDLSTSEIATRAETAEQALLVFERQETSYTAGNTFQHSDGTTSTLDEVTSFSLSVTTIDLIRSARMCLGDIAASSELRDCSQEMDGVKKSLYGEMRNILRSENATNVDKSVPELINEFGS